ncbi:MAG: CPBP family intramembrane glutamic endopeptidase [Erythrobacter sp.]
MKPTPFFLLAIGGTWLAWLVPVVMGWEIWETPAVWFLYIGGACVPLAAIILAFKAGQLRQLARRLLDPRLIPLRWWLVILLLIPATQLLSSALASLLAAEDAIFLAAPAARMSAAEFLSFAAFILILGPLPEEIGWRGYALPALLSTHSAMSATLVLGVLWCIWHIPLFFMAGYYEPFGGPPEPWLFFGNIIIISFFYTWIFTHTQGSILAAVLFHFSVNFTGEIIDLSAAGEWIRTAILAGAAIAIVGCQRQQWTKRPAP